VRRCPCRDGVDDQRFAYVHHGLLRAGSQPP
jgi:hypothetical protein